MKPILNKQIIDKYIITEFGEMPNPPTKNEMIELITNNKLTLERVKLWSLFGGDLLIKRNCGDTIIHSASYMGQIDIIEYVLDKGVNVDILNNINSTPLICASQYGHIGVINLLLERGANINHQGNYKWSALHYACVWNELKVVKILIERGIDIQLKGYWSNEKEKYLTALDIAKHRGYQKIVDYLTPYYNNN